MPEPLTVGGQLGSYLIEAVLGRGGMSTVYRARHTRLGTATALKVLAPELGADDAFRERFLREATMAAGIDHPNVVPIYDTGMHEGSLYMVMKYVAGGDLKAQLRSGGPMAPKEAVAVLEPVARALDAAHGHGLVHRDVKPANILLQRSASGEIEHVYLSDFGITKHTGSVSGLTGTGAMVGTIDYMAPEQIESGTVTARTDVYALGCVFYQCITGHVPFDREGEAAVMWAHVRDEVTPASTVAPGVPSELDAVIARAMAKDPADRFPSCREFIEACSAALGAPRAGKPTAISTPGTPIVRSPPPAPEPAPATVAATAPPPAPSSPSWLSRHWGAVALAAVLVVVAFGAGALLSSGGGDSSSGTTGVTAAQKGDLFPGALTPVPTNRITGDGDATVTLDGNHATVAVTTGGLLGGAPHAMHIHAGARGECPPAAAAHDHNGHETIATTDGIPFYGPPVVAVTTRGDTSLNSILAFRRFPNTGDIRYKRSFPVSSKVARLIRRDNAVIVIHGIDYNHNGVYDGVLDRSELDRTLPGESTAPGLCGPLVRSASTKAHASTKDVYVASLAVQSNGAWICRL
jgi:hypothetical protein